MTGQGKSAIDTLLAESFKELAKKHPIEKITIKEITDLAGVIRPTFYNHFQDKYEVLEWIITTDLLDPIEPLIQNGMISEGLVLLFTNIEKDSEFYSRAIKLEGQNSFGEIAQIGKDAGPGLFDRFHVYEGSLCRMIDIPPGQVVRRKPGQTSTRIGYCSIFTWPFQRYLDKRGAIFASCLKGSKRAVIDQMRACAGDGRTENRNI